MLSNRRSGPEKRAACRYPAHASCRIGSLPDPARASLEWVLGEINELSLSGMRLRTDRAYPEGSLLLIDLGRPDASHLYLQVVWSVRRQVDLFDLGGHLVEGSLDFRLFRSLTEEEGPSCEVPACLKKLGLTLPCSVYAVKRAYRELAMTAHPDRGGDSRQFIELHQAYRQALDLLACRAS